MIAWTFFIPACFALNCAPGPNNMLSFAYGARFGLAKAVAAGMGRMPAFAVLIGVTVIGLGAILSASATAFTVVKIAGAAYLVHTGIKLWRQAAADARATEARLPEMLRRDFAIAISNPKAIAIFTAFFPQFIDGASAAWPQLVAMGGVFLALEAVAVLLYALAGKALGGFLRTERAFRVINRGVGGFLVASGASLAITGR